MTNFGLREISERICHAAHSHAKQTPRNPISRAIKCKVCREVCTSTGQDHST